MGDKIISYGKEHYYFVLIVVGLIILIGAIRNWKWVVNPTKEDEHNCFKFFILSMFGIAGFRILMALCGIALIGAGAIFWYYTKCQ